MIRQFAVYSIDEDRHVVEQFGNLFPTVERARGWAQECSRMHSIHGAHEREFYVCEIVPVETVKWDGK